uniref:Reprolysin n=1 Tax=Rhipicephalus zambeziensis TaxID=60191 RepID=A0A224YEC9_9ACAR
MLGFMLLLGFVGSCCAQKQIFVYPSIVEERTATNNIVLRLNDELTLNLERSSVLADNLLFVTRQFSGHHYKMIDTTRIQENLYHDSHQQSSLYVTHEGGELQVEGIVNHTMRIKPLRQSERSSTGQVLHSIYEVQQIRTGYENALPYKPSGPGRLQNVIYNILNPTTRAPRHVPNFVVELHVISDERHQEPFKKDEYLVEYIAVMLNAVNRIFLDMRNPTISFKLVGLTRSTNDTFASPILDTLESVETLQGLANYTRDNGTLNNADLVYLITGGDLATLRNKSVLDKGVAGLAYVGTVCTENAVAEGEDIAKSYAGVTTMAHELAHTLGARHDPQDDPECSWSHGFLMSYEDKGSNKYRLSTCSQSNIRHVVERLPEDCINEKANEALAANETSLPGDMIVRNYYCRKILKKNGRGYFKFEQDPNNLCKLQCHYEKPNVTASTWYITVDMPEGMWCGDEKTCQRGNCIEATHTTTTQS